MKSKLLLKLEACSDEFANGVGNGEIFFRSTWLLTVARILAKFEANKKKLLHIMKRIESFPLAEAEKQKVQKAYLTNFFHKKYSKLPLKGISKWKTRREFLFTHFFYSKYCCETNKQKINCIKFCLFTRTKIKVKLIILSSEGWTGVRVRGIQKKVRTGKNQIISLR